LSFGTSLDPVSSSAARVAVTPVSSQAGSNRSTNRRPLFLSDLMWPYSVCSRTDAARGSEAKLQYDFVAGVAVGDEEGAADKRDDADTAATRIATAVRRTSDGFMGASFGLDAPHPPRRRQRP